MRGKFFVVGTVAVAFLVASCGGDPLSDDISVDFRDGDGFDSAAPTTTEIAEIQEGNQDDSVAVPSGGVSWQGSICDTVDENTFAVFATPGMVGTPSSTVKEVTYTETEISSAVANQGEISFLKEFAERYPGQEANSVACKIGIQVIAQDGEAEMRGGFDIELVGISGIPVEEIVQGFESVGEENGSQVEFSIENFDVEGVQSAGTVSLPIPLPSGTSEMMVMAYVSTGNAAIILIPSISFGLSVEGSMLEGDIQGEQQAEQEMEQLSIRNSQLMKEAYRNALRGASVYLLAASAG